MRDKFWKSHPKLLEIKEKIDFIGSDLTFFLKDLYSDHQFNSI